MVYRHMLTIISAIIVLGVLPWIVLAALWAISMCLWLIMSAWDYFTGE